MYMHDHACHGYMYVYMYAGPGNEATVNPSRVNQTIGSRLCMHTCKESPGKYSLVHVTMYVTPTLNLSFSGIASEQ